MLFLLFSPLCDFSVSFTYIRLLEKILWSDISEVHRLNYCESFSFTKVRIHWKCRQKNYFRFSSLLQRLNYCFFRFHTCIWYLLNHWKRKLCFGKVHFKMEQPKYLLNSASLKIYLQIWDIIYNKGKNDQFLQSVILQTEYVTIS